MTDELETKLLKEIEYFAKHPERIGYKVSLVNELKARLEQHRQTKKWIEGLIEREIKAWKGYNDTVQHAFMTFLDEKLKKQISGEKT